MGIRRYTGTSRDENIRDARNRKIMNGCELIWHRERG